MARTIFITFWNGQLRGPMHRFKGVPDLLFFPFTWDPSPFGLWGSRERHDLFFAFSCEPLDGGFVGIVLSVWVLMRLQTTNDIKLFGSERLVQLEIVVERRRPVAIQSLSREFCIVMILRTMRKGPPPSAGTCRVHLLVRV